MGRPRLHPRRCCSYRGCVEYPRSGRKRCDEHNSWKLEASNSGDRPPKPERGMEWCEPCQEWYESPMHIPKKGRFTSRGELAPVSLPGLLSAA